MSAQHLLRRPQHPVPAPTSDAYPPIPTNLPAMPYPGGCDWPPPDEPTVMMWWNESVPPPFMYCGTRIQQAVYPCCAAQGGEARTACARVFCRLENTTGATAEFQDCILGLKARAKDSRWSPLVCRSDVRSARRARPALLLTLLLTLAAVLARQAPFQRYRYPPIPRLEEMPHACGWPAGVVAHWNESATVCGTLVHARLYACCPEARRMCGRVMCRIEEGGVAPLWDCMEALAAQVGDPRESPLVCGKTDGRRPIVMGVAELRALNISGII
jgi:hypothetical protein